MSDLLAAAIKLMWDVAIKHSPGYAVPYAFAVLMTAGIEENE